MLARDKKYIQVNEIKDYITNVDVSNITSNYALDMRNVLIDKPGTLFGKDFGVKKILEQIPYGEIIKLGAYYSRRKGCIIYYAVIRNGNQCDIYIGERGSWINLTKPFSLKVISTGSGGKTIYAEYDENISWHSLSGGAIEYEIDNDIKRAFIQTGLLQGDPPVFVLNLDRNTEISSGQIIQVYKTSGALCFNRSVVDIENVESNVNINNDKITLLINTTNPVNKGYYSIKWEDNVVENTGSGSKLEWTYIGGITDSDTVVENPTTSGFNVLTYKNIAEDSYLSYNLISSNILPQEHVYGVVPSLEDSQLFYFSKVLSTTYKLSSITAYNSKGLNSKAVEGNVYIDSNSRLYGLVKSRGSLYYYVFDKSLNPNTARLAFYDTKTGDEPITILWNDIRNSFDNPNTLNIMRYEGRIVKLGNTELYILFAFTNRGIYYNIVPTENSIVDSFANNNYRETLLMFDTNIPSAVKAYNFIDISDITVVKKSGKYEISSGRISYNIGGKIHSINIIAKGIITHGVIVDLQTSELTWFLPQRLPEQDYSMAVVNNKVYKVFKDGTYTEIAIPNNINLVTAVVRYKIGNKSTVLLLGRYISGKPICLIYTPRGSEEEYVFSHTGWEIYLAHLIEEFVTVGNKDNTLGLNEQRVSTYDDYGFKIRVKESNDRVGTDIYAYILTFIYYGYQESDPIYRVYFTGRSVGRQLELLIDMLKFPKNVTGINIYIAKIDKDAEELMSSYEYIDTKHINYVKLEASNDVSYPLKVDWNIILSKYNPETKLYLPSLLGHVPTLIRPRVIPDNIVKCGRTGGALNAIVYNNSIKMSVYDGYGVHQDDKYPMVHVDINNKLLNINLMYSGGILKVEYVNNFIVVFRKNLVEIVDITNGKIVPLFVDCVSAKGIVSTPYGIVWCGNNYIYMLPADGSAYRVLNMNWANFYNGTMLNPNKEPYVNDVSRADIVAGYYTSGNQLWVNIAVNEGNGKVSYKNFRYSFLREKWDIRELALNRGEVTGFLDIEEENGIGMYYGSSVYLYKVNSLSYLDDGNDFITEVLLSIGELSTLEYGFVLTDVILDYEIKPNTNIRAYLEFYANDEVAPFDTKMAILDGNKKRISVLPRGNLNKLRIKFKIPQANNQANIIEMFQLNQLSIGYIPKLRYGNIQ